MNRGDRRSYLRLLERAHLEVGRAYEQVLQLRIRCPRNSENADRYDDALTRLHRAESKLVTIRAAMNGDEEDRLTA